MGTQSYSLFVFESRHTVLTLFVLLLSVAETTVTTVLVTFYEDQV